MIKVHDSHYVSAKNIAEVYVSSCQRYVVVMMLSGSLYNVYPDGTSVWVKFKDIIKEIDEQSLRSN